MAKNTKKIIQALAYLASKMQSQTLDEMKAYKLLWLADRCHLRRNGRTITGDRYYAMPRGVVPTDAKHLLDGETTVLETPDGYGRYLLHKALLRKGINDSELSSLDRLAIVGDSGMGALTYSPAINLGHEEPVTDSDRLQQIALEVLKEQQDKDAGLLLFNSGNSGGARPKAIFSDNDGHWIVKFRHTYDPSDMGVQEYHHN